MIQSPISPRIQPSNVSIYTQRSFGSYIIPGIWCAFGCASSKVASVICTAKITTGFLRYLGIMRFLWVELGGLQYRSLTNHHHANHTYPCYIQSGSALVSRTLAQS